MYKLLALDMDGTLLNKDHKISEENIKAIRMAKDMGIKVVLASGRAIQGIEEYLRELDLISDDNYSVVCSGALVLNNTRKRIIECNDLSFEELSFISDLAEKMNLKLNIYSENDILVETHSFFSKFDSVANNMPLKVVNFNSLERDTLVSKVTLINEDRSIIDEFRNTFKDVEIHEKYISSNKGFNRNLFDDYSNLHSGLTERFTVLKTTPFTLEVINKECNKGTGVKRVAQELGIRRDEIICIGDSGNDKHMISYAGLGVAMGNAFSEIKEIADYVTLSNEENGVAHVIEKFVLKRAAS